MMRGFIGSVMARFVRLGERVSRLQRTVRQLSKQSAATPLTTDFADGAGMMHALTNNRDLVFVQVTYRHSQYAMWVAKKITYADVGAGEMGIIDDPEDTDEIWIFPSPGQVLFPGARGLAAYICQPFAWGPVVHIMICGEVYGISARIWGYPDADDPALYPWRESSDGTYAPLSYLTEINGVAFGKARMRDSCAYDFQITERKSFPDGTHVRLYWNNSDEEFWFAGFADAEHGTCQ